MSSDRAQSSTTSTNADLRRAAGCGLLWNLQLAISHTIPFDLATVLSPAKRKSLGDIVNPWPNEKGAC